MRSAKKFPRIPNASGHVPRKHPPLILDMSFFEYPITRPVALNRWAIGFIIVGALAWSILITLISVAAVGYEVIPLSSTDYNATYSIWYEKFIPHGSGLIPQTWECNASIIKLNEGCPIFGVLTKVIFSSPGIVPYALLGYLDTQESGPVDGLSYVNTPLSSCEVALIDIIQLESEGAQNSAEILLTT